MDAVRLLLDVVPDVFSSGYFALKGGTAINLFVRNLPRLSIDLDLVYRDYTTNREKALNDIRKALDFAQAAIERRGIYCRCGGRKGEESKLLLERDGVRVKVEVNHVFRGTLLEPISKRLVEEAQNLFFSEMELPVLDESELYASKMVAAMDRQHPRDFFDIHQLMEAGGISPRMLDCFVAYLAGHNRPMHEVVFADAKNLKMPYENEFQGMTRQSISLETLEAAQADLLKRLPSFLNSVHREFLCSLACAEPKWSLLSFPHLQDLPAVRWKLANLRKLKKTNAQKFNLQCAELEKKLYKSA